MFRTAPAFLLVFAGVCSAARAQEADAWRGVATALGRAGTRQPDGVYRVAFPRTDLHVVLDGIEIRPALALGAWVAFQPLADSVFLLAGDLVLTEDEVSRVATQLGDGGITLTAIHNHLIGESPHLVYVHVMARGTGRALAATIRSALGATSTPITAAPGPITPLPLDTAQFAAVLGYHGKATGGVYQVSVPRADTIRVGDVVLAPSMGIASAINVQPESNSQAAAAGDLVLLESEAKPVAEILRGQGFRIFALHSHMLEDRPHLFFLHFWGHNDALTLARGLRAALAQMNVKKPV